jgi:hypothetical protein
MDTRGDVGATVRLQSIRSVHSLLSLEGNRKIQRELAKKMLPSLWRMSLEPRDDCAEASQTVIQIILRMNLEAIVFHVPDQIDLSFLMNGLTSDILQQAAVRGVISTLSSKSSQKRFAVLSLLQSLEASNLYHYVFSGIHECMLQTDLLEPAMISCGRLLSALHWTNDDVPFWQEFHQSLVNLNKKKGTFAQEKSLVEMYRLPNMMI